MDDLGEHISFLMDSESDDNENDDAAAFDHLGHGHGHPNGFANGLGHDDEEELEDEEIEEEGEDDFDAIDFGIQERMRQAQHLGDDLEPEELEDEEEEDGELSEEDPLVELESNNHYDSACFSHLRVGSDVSALFKFIDAYKPLDIDIETQLKPFTYDYIPGEFLKGQLSPLYLHSDDSN